MAFLTPAAPSNAFSAILAAPLLFLVAIAILGEQATAATVPSKTCERPKLQSPGLTIGSQGISMQLSGDMQSVCQRLTRVSESELQILYDQAAQPSEIKGNMIAGCNAGCFIGSSQAAQYTRERYNWSGKCFTDFPDDDNSVSSPTKVTNIYSEPGDISGNWASAGTLDGVFMLPGDTAISNSWSSNGGEALVLDYTEVPQYPFQMNWNDFRDEMRELAPGMWLGRVWTKPGTSQNPTGRPVPGVFFLVMQTCRENGGYALTAGERDFKPPVVAAAQDEDPQPPYIFGGLGADDGDTYMRDWVRQVTTAFGASEEFGDRAADYFSDWMDSQMTTSRDQS